ncbi:alpha/beta hydrolase [Spongiibacter sp. KMU-166]|uniref:Alpha/beta hydrolase n=1 Tax=Spongiibacter thalassae TaxID=2721624 RepID=A0ABX1GDJ6_9GAMM|nr:alpha/beta fold hydrolase [Spongiibacter thalassae]NKI16548.1 alpha/beta hydrolase [Spongiibacter thalassae]
MQRIASFNDVVVATELRGNTDSKPVVLLHGGGQTRHSRGAAATTLANNGYLAMSADLRGHGDSDWSARGEYELVHFARDVEALVRPFSRPPVLVDVVPKVNPDGVEQITGFMTSAPDGFASVQDAADARRKQGRRNWEHAI